MTCSITSNIKQTQSRNAVTKPSCHRTSVHSNETFQSESIERHFSTECRNFNGAPMKKAAAALVASPSTIRLGVGRPHASFYPWTTAEFGMSTVAELIARPGSRSSYHIFNTTHIVEALNYGNGAGSPALVNFLTEHMQMVHNPPYTNWNVCITCGSTSSMETALRIFCDRGDTVLTEEVTYPGFIEVARLLGVEVNGISMDATGLRSDVLDTVLSNWDPSQGKKPKLLYTIPSGQNPTGVSQTAERKKEIYEVARKHDLIILEDDPYCFIDLGLASERQTTPQLRESNHFPANLPSYLSMDSSGLVVRLDSFSKILSPRIRIGWVTAKSNVIEKFIAYHEVGAMASGPSQLMLGRLLVDTWGHVGFASWLKDLSNTYRKRRDIVLEACDTYFDKDICHWEVPQHGMFLWVVLKPRIFGAASRQEHPRKWHTSLQPEDIEAKFMEKALQNRVEIVQGSLFRANKTQQRDACLRLTYAAASESELEEGIKIIARVIRDDFQSQIANSE